MDDLSGVCRNTPGGVDASARTVAAISTREGRLSTHTILYWNTSHLVHSISELLYIACIASIGPLRCPLHPTGHRFDWPQSTY